MQYLYFSTIFAAMIVFFLSSLLLFSQRKSGERSRTLFACINFISVFNYLNGILQFGEKSSPFIIMPVSMLLIGIFVISTYILYPIEVISPGWLNWKRVLKIYLPITILVLLYKITLWLGVVYTPFHSFTNLFEQIGSFEVLFRILLVLLFFLPAVLLYFVPYTRKYNNTNRRWMHGYAIVVVINALGFLTAISSDSMIVRTLYYVVSVSCSLYLVYQELFVRLIRSYPEEFPMESDTQPCIGSSIDSKVDVHKTYNPQILLTFEKLEEYMNQQQAWRNPDLSLNKLTDALQTNRTYLSDALHQQGYDCYSTYINEKRIADFIQIQENNEGKNYSQTFFDVGFRSKTTAFRNFKESLGMPPSEYFKKAKEQK